MKSFLVAAISVLMLSLGTTALAGEKATKEEAQAMIKKAVAFIKQNGKEKAFAEFNNPTGQFKDRDLYIAAIDFNGKILAHGANPKLIDKVVIDMMDADGNKMIRKQIEIAKSKTGGTVTFKWPNPVTKDIESKTNLIEPLDDYFIVCGYFNV